MIALELFFHPAPTTVADDAAQVDASPVTRLARCCVWYIRRAICAMLGHEQILKFESRRLCLQCVKCGTRTPGWQIGKA